MRYLKRFNESIEDDIIEECKDILLPIVDDGIEVNVKLGDLSPNSFFTDVDKWITYSQIKITIGQFYHNTTFTLGKYIHEMEHINSYLESNGYKYDGPEGDFDSWLEKQRTNLSEKYKITIIFLKKIE